MADMKEFKQETEMKNKPKEEGVSIIDQILEKTKGKVSTKTSEMPKVAVDQPAAKPEDEDPEAYLVKSFGGYTKDSVLEFISKLKTQQKASTETFLKNMQFLYDEKDALKKTNDKLKSRLAKVETDYENLSQATLLNKKEGTEFSVKDIVSLKGKITSMEEEMRQKESEIRSLKSRLDHAVKEISELNTKLDQNEEEISAQKQLVLAEKLETKRHMDIAAEYMSRLESEQDETKYLNSIIESGEAAKLKIKVGDLTEQLSSLQKVNEKLLAEIDSKDASVATLSDQLGYLKKTVSSLSEDIADLNGVNDKLVHTNKALTLKLEEEYQKAIDMVREHSETTTEKLTFMNKLSAANMKIAILEEQLNKDRKTEKLTAAYRNINTIEAMRDNKSAAEESELKIAE